MYLAYWGLVESPFRGHLDRRFFHQGPTQEEALARLGFLTDERRTLGLLLGPSGSGKTQLLEVFGGQLGCIGRQQARLNAAALGLRDFLWEIASQLGAEPAGDAGEFGLARKVRDHLAANRYQQMATILLIDDADLATTEVLDEIMRLAEFDAASGALTMALAAQPQRLGRLGNRILEQAELRIDLEGWEADDTATFVKRALAVAGRSTPVFAEPALARLHALASGIPRRVKQLADLALLAGAGENLAQIEPETIDSVYRELGVVVAPIAPARQTAAAQH